MYCSHCKTTSGTFVKYARSKNKQYYYCSACNYEKIKKYINTEIGRKNLRNANKRWIKNHPEYKLEYNKNYQRKYRKTDIGKNKTLKTSLEYRKLHPERRKAWDCVRNEKKYPCVICGKLPTVKHHFDYSKPKEIIHLCYSHHYQSHHSKP